VQRLRSRMAIEAHGHKNADSHTDQPVDQPVDQSTDQSTDQPTDQPTNRQDAGDDGVAPPRSPGPEGLDSGRAGRPD